MISGLALWPEHLDFLSVPAIQLIGKYKLKQFIPRLQTLILTGKNNNEKSLEVLQALNSLALMGDIRYRR